MDKGTFLPDYRDSKICGGSQVHIQKSNEIPYGAIEEGTYLQLTALLSPLSLTIHEGHKIRRMRYDAFNDPKIKDVEI